MDSYRMMMWPASTQREKKKRTHRGNHQVCNNTTLDRFYVPLMNNVGHLPKLILPQCCLDRWTTKKGGLLSHRVCFGHMSFFYPGGR